MSKRLIVCCDGTWNRPDHVDDGQVQPTNVTKIALALRDRDDAGVRQRLFYGKGVGTKWHERIRGGVLGYGLSRNIQQAYAFLSANYEEGDELYFFGYSRGAYTARSIVGLVRQCGLLRPENAHHLGEAYRLYRRRDDDSHPSANEATLFRKSFSREIPQVKFIGVWDTVGALGIPIGFLNFLNRRFRFHDVKLSRTVQHAYQALSIDERRRPFQPCLWEQQPGAVGQTMEQVWFAGVHGNVGGGYRDAGLSDIALLWMVDKAKACGLAFDDGYIEREIKPSVRGKMRNSLGLIYRLWVPMAREMGAQVSGGASNELAHRSAVARMEARLSPPYRPANLKRFLERGGPVTPEADVPAYW